MKDYYGILNIDKNADLDDIKKAYRKLALKFHPDVNKSTDAAQKFQEISEATKVLKDTAARIHYDRARRYNEFVESSEGGAVWEYMRSSVYYNLMRNNHTSKR